MVEVMSRSPPPPPTPNQYYFSAPTSPSHLIYRDDHFEASNSNTTNNNNNGDDFAFDVSQEWDQASLPAEELFHNGLIKPLTSPRGRQRRTNSSKRSSRRAVRSLSPVRDTQYAWQEGEDEDVDHDHNMMTSKTPTGTSGVCSTLVAYTKLKKWRLKDLFLFRSASEGRAAEKDPLKNYTAALKPSSFRAVESLAKGGSGSGSRRRGPVSAHELHYTVNRAVSEDLKKKTFLPYKQGILGRLAFNPAAHALANGFGFSRK